MINTTTYGFASKNIDFAATLDWQQGNNKQGYNEDCGLVSVENILIEMKKITHVYDFQGGYDKTETDVVQYAIDNGDCWTKGSTCSDYIINVLKGLGNIASRCENITLETLGQYLKTGFEVIAEVDAYVLWECNNNYRNTNHAITVTGVVYNDVDPTKIDGFYICDSGRSSTVDADEYISYDLMKRASLASTGTGNFIITDQVIPTWTTSPTIPTPVPTVTPTSTVTPTPTPATIPTPVITPTPSAPVKPVYMIKDYTDTKDNIVSQDHFTNGILTEKDFFDTKHRVTEKDCYTSGSLTEKDYYNNGNIKEKDLLTGGKLTEKDLFDTKGNLTEKDIFTNGSITEEDLFISGKVTTKNYLDNRGKIKEIDRFDTNGGITEKDYLSNSVITEKDYLINNNVTEKDYIYAGMVVEKDFLTTGKITEKDLYSTSGRLTEKDLYSVSGLLTGKIYFDNKGNVIEKSYFANGNETEEDYFATNGTLTSQKYFTNGKLTETDSGFCAGGKVTNRCFYGTGTYTFNKGDGIQFLSDPGGNEVLKLNNFNKNDIAYFKDTANNLVIGFKNDTVDKITISHGTDKLGAFSKIQLSDGSFITPSDINRVLQNMTMYPHNQGTNITLA